MTRHLATSRESQLLPPFTRARHSEHWAEIKVWVNGGSNYDSLEVAECLVI